MKRDDLISKAHFNPRSREGSDRVMRQALGYDMTFQSTLPRRERPFTAIFTSFTGQISIHAPAKGATAVHCRYETD